jgi:hypothetical protein
MDDETLTRQKPRSTLLPGPGMAGVRTPVEKKPEPPEGDDDTGLPSPDDDYVAHSRPANKPVPTLRFIMADWQVRGLPYANLDSIDLVTDGKPGASPAIVIRYSGIVPREARITGRHVVTLYDKIADHRIAWVRVLPKGRDFHDAAETVITGSVIERITQIPE